LLSC
jgi:chaperonin GroEL